MVDQQHEDGSWPLYIASQRGHNEVVRALLSAGAKVNQQSKGGASPLYIASHEGHGKVVHTLLSAGAIVNL